MDIIYNRTWRDRFGAEVSAHLLKYLNMLGIEYEEQTNSYYFNGEKLNTELNIPDGYYFLLGDNRYGSLDSRIIGLISKEDIKGKIVFRIFPFNKIQKI